MAYAAVISLKQTIHRFLNSSHTPLASSSREILEFAFNHVASSQEFLKKFYDVNSKRWNALDVKIRDAAQKLEDALEFIVSNQFLSLPDTHVLRYLDFEEAEQAIISFVETMKKMEEEYVVKDESDELDDDGAGAAVSPNIDFGVKMVGLSKEYAELRDRLLKPMRPYDFGVFSFVGKKGSSRSLFAKAIFDEVFVGKEQPFDCGAWVTVGPNSQLTEILVQILAQIDDHDLHPRSNCHVLDKLGEDLYASLRGRRYLIALDGIDDVEVWGYLGKLFPEQDNGSLILLATGIMEVAQFAKSFYIHEMPVLVNDHFVWDFLRMIMFGIEKTIHPELERSGKTIAANCGRSRIALARVVMFLNKAEKTPECWSKLAADKLNSIFVVEDEISEVCKIKEDVLRYDENIRSSITSVVQVSSGTNIIKEYLFPERYFPKSEIMLICGMAGIGKTTLIKNIFEDSLISHHFDHCVWVTLGPRYKSEEILVDILAQIYPNIHRNHLKEDTELGMELCDELSHKRCFLVLDDLWSPEPVHQLKALLPNIRAEIFVTTRLPIVGLNFSPDDRFYTIRLLNREESWDLFCKKVFSDGPCPPQLEKAGKKISKNCEGLPLLILTIASLLAKTEKTLEYWNTVAEKQDSILGDAYDRMLKVLYPSYEYLPQHLKACFLYMGVFPRSYVIPTSKLIRLWVAEGFLEPDASQMTVEDFGVKCLKDVVLRSLVMVKNKDYEPKSSKTCSLHSVFWLLSSNEAENSKFFHALNGYGDSDSTQGTDDQRRVCIRNNILLGIKGVHNSMSTRSLLCTGPHHRYPVPISFRPRLLRVVDALSVRLYEFPIEAVGLIHLRYLALTCSGGIPPSISKLRNLENLIVGQHSSTNSKSCRDSSFLPMEIWNMKEMKYLRVTGCNLPIPNSGDVLANLSTLLDVCIDSCNMEVLNGVPNLRKLGVRIELEPGDTSQCFHYLNHISCLNKLESLKCVVVNPELGITPPAPHSMFPPGLKKLSLSGLGYPWSFMSIIGSLQNLEVLKLRCYAFRGRRWETDYVSFCKVKFLSIEDTDLEEWRTRNPSFYSMKYLRIKDCYNLRELPHYLTCTETLEVADCSPAAVAWAEQMREVDWESRVGKLTSLHVHSSWDDTITTSSDEYDGLVRRF